MSEDGWDQSINTPNVQRYAWGNPHYEVYIVKALKGVNTNEGRNFGWCYHHKGNGWLWKPLHVETLEEAKALALVLWRMGE